MNAMNWIFYFDEGHIAVAVSNAEQDYSITKSISNKADGFTLVQEGKPNVFVNLAKVKCITREEVQPAAVVETEVVE